jgi:hypothetical protein
MLFVPLAIGAAALARDIFTLFTVVLRSIVAWACAGDASEKQNNKPRSLMVKSGGVTATA